MFLATLNGDDVTGVSFSEVSARIETAPRPLTLRLRPDQPESDKVGKRERSEEEPGGARTSQDEPGRARTSQEEPGGARRGQEEPGEPGGA